MNGLKHFLKELTYSFKSLRQNISNLIYYFPLVWKDRWYDFYYLEEFIVYKLDNMIRHWDKNNYVGGNFTKLRIIVIRNAIYDREDKIQELQYDYIIHKKYTKEEYHQQVKKINDKSYGRLGRNIYRFWD